MTEDREQNVNLAFVARLKAAAEAREAAEDARLKVDEVAKGGEVPRTSPMAIAREELVSVPVPPSKPPLFRRKMPTAAEIAASKLAKNVEVLKVLEARVTEAKAKEASELRQATEEVSRPKQEVVAAPLEGEIQTAPFEEDEEEAEEPASTDLALTRWPNAPVDIPYGLRLMNSRHAVITDAGGGKAIITTLVRDDINPQHSRYSFQGLGDLRLVYKNKTVKIPTRDKDGNETFEYELADKWWLHHPDRQEFDGVTFQPGKLGVIHRKLNLWRGWGIQPKQGDWDLIRWHIEHVFAPDCKEASEYVFNWLAYGFQHPDERAEVALTGIGIKGTGKGTLGHTLRRIYAPYSWRFSSVSDLLGRFNEEMKACTFLWPDEMRWSAKHDEGVGKLQSIITEETLTVEPKFIGRYQTKNTLKIFITAEPGHVIPAGGNERRFAVTDVSDEKRDDTKYFQALHRQINGGGAAAMLYDLKRRRLDPDWHPRYVPTELKYGKAIQRQQIMHLSPFKEWVVMLLHDGVLPGPKLPRIGAAFTKALHDDIRARVPRNADLSEREMTETLKKEWNCEPYPTKWRAAWQFPSLVEARAAWEAIYGPTVWDYPDANWTWTDINLHEWLKLVKGG
jgi:hypothetical protein